MNFQTSLATVIAKMTKGEGVERTRFVKLSATSSGIADIREAVSSAAKELKLGRRTIVFMDEIHRFNKLQQDIFLPHVEAGTFTLIGATTENPSFSLNSALLSRCRVFVLEKLSKFDIMAIIEKGIRSLGGDLRGATRTFEEVDGGEKSRPRFLIDEEAAQWLAEACDGDARVALGGLEIATKTTITSARGSGPCILSVESLKAGLEKTHTLSDRKSDLNYDLISAMQKSVRAGDSNAALYWLARVMAGGEDPVYIARRLVRVASEDVGLEDGSEALGRFIAVEPTMKFMHLFLDLFVCLLKYAFINSSVYLFFTVENVYKNEKLRKILKYLCPIVFIRMKII